MPEIVSWCDAGMARFTCHDPHNVYDVIPCDLVASGILVAACALTKVRNSGALSNVSCDAARQCAMIMASLM